MSASHTPRTDSDTATDAIVAEVIRHRLDAINEEAAATLKRVSGSPIAVESNDLNTVITAADGQVVACGFYVLGQVASMHLVIDHLLAEYADNPGIGPGDQFITNDPYLGTLHQPDVVLVAPIFHDGELVAWTGSVVHQMDVGGPTPGGMDYQARSVFDEAPPMPPMRIVEHGVVRRDIEREYLSRSRTPELNALDLAGQIAANQTAVAQVQTLCARYGANVVTGVMARMLDGAERAVRERLASLPDGEWRDRSYIEYRRGDAADGMEEVYVVDVVVTKRGDTLTLDLSGSSDQAPGAINAGYGALANYTLGTVMIYLCAGLPWVPGGISRAVQVISRPGTVVHARWPAGVAMATGSTIHGIRTSLNVCFARMLQADPALGVHVLAPCQSSGAGGGALSGVGTDGAPFASMTLDEVSGGGGAQPGVDGADTAGFTTSPGSLNVNVETNEAYLPVRYLRRAELADSGGPGTWRGGVGALHALTSAGTTAPIEVLSFGQGLQHPQATGLAGGEPGATSTFAIVPGDGLDQLLSGVGAHVPMPTAGMQLAHGWVHVVGSQGGGGFGDPIERDPAAVERDVADGLVSVSGAVRDYAVVVRDARVDRDATQRCRAERRRARLGGREPNPARPEPPEAVPFDHTLALEGDTVVCRRCGHGLARRGDDHLGALVIDARPVAERAPLGLRYSGTERFEVRHFYCPSCARQLDVQIARRTDPVVPSARVFSVAAAQPSEADAPTDRVRP